MALSSCIVCGHPVDTPWLENCADLYLRTTFRVNYGVCHHCRLVQQVPIPLDTGSFYPAYPMHQPRKIIYDWARKLLHRQIYFHPPHSAASAVLLDFGCGDGSYLRAVRSKIGRIIGFEPDPKLAKTVSVRLGAPVYSDLRKLVAELAGSVDYITTHFVLEHLTDFQEVFQSFENILKPGGILHAVVPNIRSWEARLFGRKWHGLDAPRHISFPDEVSLEILSEQHGLQLKKMSSAVFPNTLAASLATIMAGHYQHGLFLVFIPLSLLLSCIAPSGTRSFIMQKRIS